jgi:predicted dehydrogenase
MNAPTQKVRLGFVGVGWIGLHRMRAILAEDCAELVGIVEPAERALVEARKHVPDAQVLPSLEALLSLEPDGVVIATPSALHAQQCMTVLKRGSAVFCQKPLARDANETAEVVMTARRADRLLAVDFSYRHTRAAQALKRLLDERALGRVYAARFVFHNAYGPDKAWYLDRHLSGGGCLVDLGIHLVDLACWMLPEPIRRVHGARYAGGKRLSPEASEVEDYAQAILELESGAHVELVCSWNLHAGRDAVIEGELFGTKGGARFHNVNGSFYDFAAEHMRGTGREELVTPPDEWGGRAAVHWVKRLHESRAFDESAFAALGVAQILDQIVRSG